MCVLPIGGIMRLLPLRDSEADFAVVNPLLLQQQQLSKTAAASAGDKSKKSSGASMLAWLFVVGLSLSG